MFILKNILCLFPSLLQSCSLHIECSLSTWFVQITADLEMCKMFTMCVIIIMSKKMHIVCVCVWGGGVLQDIEMQVKVLD